MRHNDGIDVRLRVADGTAVTEYFDPSDEGENAPDDSHCKRHIAEKPGTQIEVIVSFDNTWRNYTADGVWVELRSGAPPEAVGIEDYSQLYFIDAQRIEIAETHHNFPSLTIWNTSGPVVKREEIPWTLPAPTVDPNFPSSRGEGPVGRSSLLVCVGRGRAFSSHGPFYERTQTEPLRWNRWEQRQACRIIHSTTSKMFGGPNGRPYSFEYVNVGEDGSRTPSVTMCHSADLDMVGPGGVGPTNVVALDGSDGESLSSNEWLNNDDTADDDLDGDEIDSSDELDSSVASDGGDDTGEDDYEIEAPNREARARRRDAIRAGQANEPRQATINSYFQHSTASRPPSKRRATFSMDDKFEDGDDDEELPLPPASRRRLTERSARSSSSEHTTKPNGGLAQPGVTPGPVGSTAGEQSLVVRLAVPRRRRWNGPTVTSSADNGALVEGRRSRRPVIDLTVKDDDDSVRIKKEGSIEESVAETPATSHTAVENMESEEWLQLELQKIEIKQKIIAMRRRN